jgi:hypothetical protein
MAFVTYLQHNTLRGLEILADAASALAHAEDLWASGRMARITVETVDEAGTLVCLLSQPAA